ncbi:hypothetical protein QOZ80_3BG0252530 [Eleusine coracana subsp. coracana]|nr:hypothetical protein QOZ80_3BG0252530 [Eleusine coracana subsp. coracana]
MGILMLAVASVPIALVWLKVDAVLLLFGQRPDIAATARVYVLCLLPDLLVTSFLNPLKAYLSSQEVTWPTLLASCVALAVHIPLTMWMSAHHGIRGVPAAVWIADLAVALILAACVFIFLPLPAGSGGGGGFSHCYNNNTSSESESESEKKKKKNKGRVVEEWVSLLRLAVACCLNTCLEWWSYEILILLTGRLPDARRMVAVIAIVLNLDYLLFSAMLSLSVSASVRVSNELGAGNAAVARRAARVSIVFGVIAGVVGGLLMLAFRHTWARIYTTTEEVRSGVGKAMEVMALLEVVNFPLNVCGGIVRGTARPLLGMYAVVGGFYVVALPVGVALGFKARLGLQGLLAGFLVGAAASLAVLVTLIVRMDWTAQAQKATTRPAGGLLLPSCDAGRRRPKTTRAAGGPKPNIITNSNTTGDDLHSCDATNDARC